MHCDLLAYTILEDLFVLNAAQPDIFSFRLQLFDYLGMLLTGSQCADLIQLPYSGRSPPECSALRIPLMRT